MGIHFVNSDLVGDGILNPAQPEALLYEFNNGQMQLAALAYVVITEAWHSKNKAPPVLMGRLCSKSVVNAVPVQLNGSQ